MKLSVNNYNSPYANKSKSKSANSVNLQKNFKSHANPQFKGLNMFKGLNINDKLSDLLIDHYFVRFYKSNLAKWIVDHTQGEMWNNMTKHMSFIGSTLISGMYVTRTLSNDKLDPHKRKTLAINDGLVWGLSSFLSYFLDAKLNNSWNNLSTRYAANYLLRDKNDRAKALKGELQTEYLNAADKTKYLKDWKPSKIKFFMQKWHTQLAEDIPTDDMNRYHDLIKDKFAKEMKKYIDPKKTENFADEVTKNFSEDLKELVKSEYSKENNDKILEKFKTVFKDKIDPSKLEEIGKTAIKDFKSFAYKNILDFNLDVLQDKPLTTRIKGLNVLKSLFVFGMVYRYIVPVLVMKPANWIGKKMHECKENKDNKALNKTA